MECAPHVPAKEIGMMRLANTFTHEAFLLNLAGSLSVTAGLFHVMVMPEHFQEWWGYGLFFFVCAIAQTIYGVALLTRAWGINATGVFAYVSENSTRAFYLAGIAGNLALVILYGITRTTGIPLGPNAGEIEPFSSISVVSKVLELALVACLMLLLAQLRHRAAERDAALQPMPE